MLKLNFKSKKIKFSLLIVIGILIICYFHFTYNPNITIKLNGFPSQEQWEDIKKQGKIKGINKLKHCILNFNENNYLGNCMIEILNQQSTKPKHNLNEYMLDLRGNNVEIQNEVLEKDSTYDVNTSYYLDDEQMIQIINRIYENRNKIINNFTKNDDSTQGYCFIVSGMCSKISNNTWYLSKDNDFKKFTNNDSDSDRKYIRVTSFITYSNSKDSSDISFFVEY